MDQRVKDVQRSIDEALIHALEISALADQVKLSVRRLEELFEAELGVSPKEYQVNQRLLKAAELLADFRFRVSEVGYKVGFQSPSNFSKAFKKKFGACPRVFRMNLIMVERSAEES